MSRLSRRLELRALQGGGRRLGLALRLGGPTARALALRQLGEGEADPALLLPFLDSPVPGLRGAAAWALGRLAPRGGVEAAPLATAAARERCDEPRLLLGLAAARAGAPLAEVWALLLAADGRQIWTCYGLRPLGGVGHTELARRWTLALGRQPPDGAAPPLESTAVLRARALADLERAPDDPAALESLAAARHPSDLPRLLAATTGRRAAMRRIVALGIHGDPGSLDPLIDVLGAVDVDPGHGFASRAAAAMSLGRLGLPEADAALVRALEDEALDHEGRPGAGLGVQRPVRAAILSALGECGSPAQSPVLTAYLGDTSGSAQGGFYLPAMAGLVKLGQTAPVLALALRGPELAALNAVGVLDALGARAALDQVARARRDAVGLAARQRLDSTGV